MKYLLIFRLAGYNIMKRIFLHYAKKACNIKPSARRLQSLAKIIFFFMGNEREIFGEMTAMRGIIGAIGLCGKVESFAVTCYNDQDYAIAQDFPMKMAKDRVVNFLG